MSSNKDSVGGTIKVALILCVICSVFISSAAVILKPFQISNKLLDRNKNILIAAGMFDPALNSNAEIGLLFSRFNLQVVDLDSGEVLSAERLAELRIDPATYDERAVFSDPAYSDALSADLDVADLKRRVKYATVYTLEASDGSLETIVLPVSGYGLWGTMYGYLALDGDGNTVNGIGFYDHKETPGLGGEINNPRWKALWPGKQVYDADGDVALSVVKGGGEGVHEVDGLAGASLTSRGVDNMIEFWLGPNGFGPFLNNLSEG
ncbi:MAG: Na(+)-translocating NADH-quinone reductase subunit C [Gammaproteobacteria bacterium]|nr:Na(+)-translocating NADH-quinone reductase subunit C [Gammaproteobacteria bacterium]MDP2139242.1 Na(+)-translocating NADH-quinone reductase subunit C [Gammaproteobacteria bacterium]MDP2348989.1 Na(+)-translocating NADH-quinone reductase subunit C [Gammaproteobacteria bacterium]